MSRRTLQQISTRIRDAAGRAYIAQQLSKREREDRRESDREVRAAMRGWLAAESAS